MDSNPMVTLIQDQLYFVRNFNRVFHEYGDYEYNFMAVDNSFTKSGNYFGPPSLGAIFTFNKVVENNIRSSLASGKKLVLYEGIPSFLSKTDEKITNLAFLVGTFMLSNLKYMPEDAYAILKQIDCFVPFQGVAVPNYNSKSFELNLLDCLNGFYRALQANFFAMDSFDRETFDLDGLYSNGYKSWIVPNKMLAFASPGDHTWTRRVAPEKLLTYFKSHNIKVVVRLSRKFYDSKVFTEAGINHYELYINDFTTPSIELVEKFLKICKDADEKGEAVAVHCSAGLGRTGTMIGCYMLKKYGWTAKETVAWCRMARPGSIIGFEQNYIEDFYLHLNK